jgi:prolyl oligopeptidase
MRLPRLATILVAALASTVHAQPSDQNDPYLWLEDAHGEKAMSWVNAENAETLNVLEKDSRYPTLYAAALKIAEAKDRIPIPRVIDGEVYNFWQDADHVRGVWRKTTLSDYRVADPHWTTVLDLDAFSTAEKANWFIKGEACEQTQERRCMIDLSDGGEDAVTVREFDLAAQKFVDHGFVLPKGKQREAWETPDSLQGAANVRRAN